MTTTIQWVKVMKPQLVGLQTNGETYVDPEEADPSNIGKSMMQKWKKRMILKM